MRTLTFILAVALIVITTTSAYIRFKQAGLGCAEWPACYGAQAASLTPALDEGDPLFLPRALHRVAASIAGILVLVIAVIGWEQWTRQRAQWIAVLLVILAAALAWLGLATPSPLPIITLGNLLGGMAMLALAIRLFVGRVQLGPEPAQASLPRWARAAILISVAQIALGGMIGARFGATACNSLPGCAGADAFSAVSLSAFNPMIATSALTIQAGAIEAIHLLHRAVAVALALTGLRIAWLASNMTGALRATGYSIGILVVAQLASGAWLALQPALGIALLHNLGAALLLAGFASLAVAPPHSALKS